MASNPVRVVDTGITCLHGGGENPKADVVFVHGLGGHPQKAWSTKAFEPKASAEPLPLSGMRRAVRKLFKGVKNDHSSKTAPSVAANDSTTDDDNFCPSTSEAPVFWPRDLLPTDFKDVRVMTFGYSSSYTGSTQNNLYSLSKDLLSAIDRERKESSSRPIIFIVHSLGGILTKYALRISRDSSGADVRRKDIRTSTKGVIFFGTPHSGANDVGLAETVRRIAGIYKTTNPTLLASLDPQRDNGQLEDLRNDFNKMLGPASEGKFRVHSFTETEPMRCKKLMVPRSSAQIASEWATDDLIAGNHVEMCKFGGRNDTEYKKLRHVLHGYIQAVTAERMPIDPEQETDREKDQKSKWMQALYTCLYSDRKNINPPRVDGTCEWFMSHQRFQSWRDRDCALLWVSADPGCGKSVLARYLVDDVLVSRDTAVTCYFFFKDGFPDQTTSTGAMCCLIRQTFEQRPTLFSHGILTKFENGGDRLLSSFSGLWGILVDVATENPRFTFTYIIDALDECEEKGRDEIIEEVTRFYLSPKSKNCSIKFLITSRPYRNIKHEFSKLEKHIPTIHLSGEDEEEVGRIADEINLVIRHRLTELVDYSTDEQEILADHLTRVPNRTYLWVHLIFSELKNAIHFTPGDDIWREIQKIPSTVDDAYNAILAKSKDLNKARKLLHIVVAAYRPLNLQEMAISLKIEPEHQSLDDLRLQPKERFRNEVRDLCGLLVTVIDEKIYLLHQTAREFLVPMLSSGESPSTEISTLAWKSSLQPAKSNRILAEICMWRLSWRDYDLQTLENHRDRESLSTFNPESLPSFADLASLRGFKFEDRKNEYFAKRPFLVYSARYWADHFRLGDFQGKTLSLNMALDYCSMKRPTSKAWVKVLRAHSDSSFVAATQTPLVIMAYFGLVDLADSLLEEYSASINSSQGGLSMEIPLHVAARKGHETVVQRLLAAGADPGIKDIRGSTPLHTAAREGHETIVQRLLTAGADLGIKHNRGVTPLHAAAVKGHENIIQRLLTAGADPEIKTDGARTPLHVAAEVGHENVVQRLLTAGADPGIKTGGARTPLHVAAVGGHENIVRRLLTAGADPNIRDKKHETPLSLAFNMRRKSIVQILLAAGASTDDLSDFKALFASNQ